MLVGGRLYACTAGFMGQLSLNSVLHSLRAYFVFGLNKWSAIII